MCEISFDRPDGVYYSGESVTITLEFKSVGTQWIGVFNPDTLQVLAHGPYGTKDITQAFRKVADGVYKATLTAGDPGTRTVEVNAKYKDYDIHASKSFQVISSPNVCPDLEMEDIWVEPSSFAPGQQVTIRFKAKNIGNANASSFVIKLLFDGREIGSARIEGLAAGKIIEGRKENFLWPSDTGCHAIQVILDALNEVQECNERNNILEKTFCPSTQPTRKVRVYVYAIEDANRFRSYNIENVMKIPGAQIRVDYPGGWQILTTTSTYPGPYVQVDENSTVTVSLVAEPPGWTFTNYWDIYTVSWMPGPTRTFNVGTTDKHVAAAFTQTGQGQELLVKFRGIVVECHNKCVKITEIIQDQTGHHYIGETVVLLIDPAGSPQIDPVSPGDFVEVFGAQYWEHINCIELKRPHHYLKKLSGAQGTISIFDLDYKGTPPNSDGNDQHFVETAPGASLTLFFRYQEGNTKNSYIIRVYPEWDKDHFIANSDNDETISEIGQEIGGYRWDKETFVAPHTPGTYKIKVVYNGSSTPPSWDKYDRLLIEGTLKVSKPSKVPTSLTLELIPSSVPEYSNTRILARGRLVRRDNGQGIPNKQITFSFAGIYFEGYFPEVAYTDYNGNYQTQLLINFPAGPCSIIASFAGDDEYEESTAIATLTVTPSKKPDLVAVDLWWEPKEVYEGDEVMFYYIEKNQGDVASGDFENAVFVDGQRIGISARGSLAPGQERQRQTTTRWKATAGEHIVVLEVDYGKEIDEWDEQNNRLEKRLVVYEGKPSVEITEVTTNRSSYSKEGGSPVVITVKVKNTGKGPVSGLRINVDIADPTGKNVKEGVFEENISLRVGEEMGFTKAYWTIPPGLQSGKYTVTAAVHGPANIYSEKKTSFVIALYELFIEIDYLVGYKPNERVLEYITQYFLLRDVHITFYVDDAIFVEADAITDEDFWRLEEIYNDMGDDSVRSGWFGRKYITTSKWKWVLYTRSLSQLAAGRTTIATPCDDTSGNYIAIALGEIRKDAAMAAQVWGTLDEATVAELIEAKTLMHELGHAIGIIKLVKSNNSCEEEYSYFPPDCVMFVLSPGHYVNRSLQDLRYSEKAWELANLEYYIIPVR
ncbi:MAG: CARDB domain-containing protein [Candidatus Bathyarchaeia archaeon]